MSDDREEAAQSPWALRADVLSTRVLLWLAGGGRLGEPTPDVHLYLYHRYWRLAEYHARCGHAQRAARSRRKAEEHYQQSGHDGPPFAAAMALAIPRPLLFTRAVAEPPDNAA